jgi:hypothetical protein
MITEPGNGWAKDRSRTPLQDLETLYIGGTELAVVRRTLRPVPLLKFLRPPATMVQSFDHGTLATRPNQVYARLQRKFVDHDVYPRGRVKETTRG